jgi:uncharacterized protein YndB with AHSA1/START domain
VAVVGDPLANVPFESKITPGGATMFKKSSSVYIAASPETVYDYVSDIPRHPEWTREKMECEPVEGDPTRFKTVTRFGIANPAEVRVTGAERPRRFVYESDGSPSIYLWTFDLEPEGAGTRLTHSFERVNDALWVKAIHGMVYRLVGRAMLEGGLSNIKARLEKGESAAA